MVNDNQVKKLFMLVNNNHSIKQAAMKTGMDEKTARKYVRSRCLPSQNQPVHDWTTRPDPFESIWQLVKEYLELNPELQAKFVFEHLQRTFPGVYQDGQLRTFQRKVKYWRAVNGPPKEVYFPQRHDPGALCQSDFTDMSSLAVTIGHRSFTHLVYHFVLTYSNWETASICYSESFESLSGGLQEALWRLGGVPVAHRTDRLTAAVHNDLSSQEFTHRYVALLDHYGLDGQKTNRASPHENGDIEQRHYRFKKAVDQSLMLRGSRNFECIEDYQAWLDVLIDQLNSGRKVLFEQEKIRLNPLPAQRVDSFKRLRVRVGPWSTIRVSHNTYSVDSRLIGEYVDVRLYGDYMQVWYGQKQIDRIPRLRGEDGHRIVYRHIIDSLVRKPGAFKNYRYRQDLFPTHRFRMAYDQLKDGAGRGGDIVYLRLLYMAARTNEAAVDHALRILLEKEQPIEADVVERMVKDMTSIPVQTDVCIHQVELSHYDQLLQHAGGLI